MTIDDMILEMRDLTEQVGSMIAAGTVDKHSDPELTELVELINNLDQAGLFGSQGTDPDPLMRTTIELGAVAGLGDDCAVDVITSNMPVPHQLLETLLMRAGAPATTETTHRLPDSILNPTRKEA